MSDGTEDRRQRQLHAALDDELGPQQRADLDRYLLRHPEARQELDAMARLDSRVADALAAAIPPSTMTPEDLFHAVTGRRRARRLAWVCAAAAAGLLALGGWLTWSLTGPAPRDGSPVASRDGASTAPVMAARQEGRTKAGELLLDVSDTSPLLDVPRTGDRVIDRQYLGVFDEKTNELYLIEVNRERTRVNDDFLDL